MSGSRQREASAATTSLPKTVRQAVVIVHGMGEQRPLDMLNRFIKAALPGLKDCDSDGDPVFYSRPEHIAGSYEARRFLAPKRMKEDGSDEVYAQTEFFEYHWAHLMQGNRLSDMWATVRHMMSHWPPRGMRGIWVILWVIILALISSLILLDFDFATISGKAIVAVLFGGGLFATVVNFIRTKLLPTKITSTFVDVVRYLDTSPRSYAVRKKIRKGMVDYLQGLHDRDRYQRIIVVAHSLGAYIAYDGITHLWSQMNQVHGKPGGLVEKADIERLETAAKSILDEAESDPADFRGEQRKLWLTYRRHGCPWLITDFVTVGTPMYMADKLLTKNRKTFDERVKRRQISTCPPQPDLPGPTRDKSFYSYPYKGKRVLYHAAPFALVRWTNMWFPARLGFFGDWFGGPLGPLFGRGIKDIELRGNRPRRFLPAIAHTLYFSFGRDTLSASVTTKLHEAMGLDSTSWLEEFVLLDQNVPDAASGPDSPDPLGLNEKNAVVTAAGSGRSSEES